MNKMLKNRLLASFGRIVRVIDQMNTYLNYEEGYSANDALQQLYIELHQMSDVLFSIAPERLQGMFDLDMMEYVFNEMGKENPRLIFRVDSPAYLISSWKVIQLDKGFKMEFPPAGWVDVTNYYWYGDDIVSEEHDGNEPETGKTQERLISCVKGAMNEWEEMEENYG